MFRLFFALLFLAAIAIAVAFWRNWLTFSVDHPDGGDTDIKVTVHEKKFREDVQQVQDSINKRGAHEIKGKVASVDADKKTIAVQGSDATVTLKVSEATTIRLADREANFADLQPGVRVTATYVAQDGTNTARSIRVDGPAREGSGEDL